MKMKKKGYAMGGMKKGYSKGGMKKKGFAAGGMPTDAPKPPMGGAPKMTPEMIAKAKKAAALKKKMGGRNMSAKPAMPMGSPPAMPMGGAPKMPMMKKGGMAKKGFKAGGVAKKGKAKGGKMGGKSKVRGAGIAQRGVRPAKMR